MKHIMIPLLQIMSIQKVVILLCILIFLQVSIKHLLIRIVTSVLFNYPKKNVLELEVTEEAGVSHPEID